MIATAMPRSMPTRRTLPAFIAIAACVAVGTAMSLRAPVTPLIAIAAAVAVVSLQWRTGVIVMLIALPFSGIPAFVAGSSGLAGRDLLIVLPLYTGFALEMVRRREPVLPAMGIALPALAVFAALVLAYAPSAPSSASGAIALRVWLAYIPMVAVGYTFVRRIEDAETVLKLTALLGLIPAAIALAECVYASQTGGFGPLEHLYGSWRLDEAGRFVVLSTGSDGHIRIPRVPSTFTSVSQYFGFALVAFSCALSMALRRRTAAWALCAAVLGAAALASGARAAYVMVPAVAVVSIVIDDFRAGRCLAVAALFVALCGTAIAIGLDPIAIARELPSHALVTLDTAWTEMRGSLRFAGHGTGWDTNAALRYGNVAQRRYIENWYAKASLELGIAGLVAIVAAFSAIGFTLLRSLVKGDRRARQMAGPLVVMLLVTMGALFKGPYIDLDPLNVYFWLLLGITMALFSLSNDEAAAATDAGAQ